MKIKAIKFTHIFIFIFILAISNIISSCTSTSANKYPTLPNNITGKLVFVGIPLPSSGGLNSTGEHTYWQFNILSRNYILLDANQQVIGQENFKERVSYYICTRDKQKLLATQEPLIYELMKICKDSSNKSLVQEDYIRGKLGLINSDDITTPAGDYRIISDHQNKTITITNKFNKPPVVIKFDNDFGYQTLSPDSSYLALLESNPGTTNFGIKNQLYRIRFINIVTGQVFSTENDKIVLPIALEWIR